jgi:PTH1 family peptidyl-tRNA hydrolase
MKLLVGLGNPGPEYARTRHNLGFLLTELLAERDARSGSSARGPASAGAATLFEPAKTFRPAAVVPAASLQAETSPAGLPPERAAASPGSPLALSGFSWRWLSDSQLLLVRPARFMTRSGEPLAPLLRALGWTLGEPAPILVAYDDLDLPLGALRLRAQGGHGGHNGMRSILSSLGTDRFPRLRIGIGRGGTDAARHVLEEFTPAEWVEMQISLQEAAEAVLAWAGGLDLDQCMTRFHSRWTQGR